MADRKETLHDEKMNQESASKKVETKKEYPAAGLEDVVFNTAATEDELLVNTGSIRAVRKEVVENAKANPEDPVKDDAKELTSKKVETKKEYPAAALEDVIFNTAATEGELLVNTESIRAVQKEVVENVKANPEDPAMDDVKDSTSKKIETKKEFPAAGLEDVIFNTAATEGELLVNTESIRAVRKEVVENVKTNPVDVKETKKKG